ncbi:hypothetical protein LTR99_005979 [Exophiala xenobiotica]|uniref:Xylanolytic transcriptional activator regulatory domain-containing protein n=1 Tax=Vermiconidia calcicola TaxID=1690605 RepID=A0AAV9QFI9_9PEZI|nr:hypothetical protein LTR92_006132 [Exophiala xenobiotica]KAK5540949.1 hypothetical protein LTR25_002726 [Vermiconidia calcicola]KAK5549560.1 hypothetical protein LTR23_000668 [Chaetothyriales sp. CCFEE 6169]KAK5208182.1 hypothetical protein LTR41_006118 [Exophiala xenobiotica]KAK5222967.1 hypothetical protein LTR72_005804 [Exophiala xenobiotica]
MSNAPGVYQSLSAKLPHFQSPLKSVFLPPKDEASSLLDYYVKYVDELQHVVFMPQVRKLMDTLYANVDQGLLTPPSHVALILTILATSAALSSHQSGDCRLLSPPSVAAHASLVWANSALEVLEFSRRTTAGGLEDIQASILMAFLLHHVEGFSARSRRLFAGAISTARDLGMHRLDATSGPSADPKKSVDPVDVEIQRRVWWHVVATDWLLGLSGGPQEGTYFVQPNHFRVNLPRNIDDKALIYGRPLAEEPLSKPTTMSYYIQRIKLADICRSVVDVMPLSGVSTSVDYQQIIALDAKFQAFFDELPTFLKVDEKSRLETEEIMLHSPQLRIQRYALGMIARTRRCKLHQPFLIRRSVESHYTYSRDISISSARCVIRLKRQVEKELDSVNIVNVKLHGVVYHVFMATIVLVMDLCFNKNEGDDDDRKSEVAAACTILEEAARQSGLAREFLNSLMGIMRKHKVHLHHLSEEAADFPQPGQQGLPGSEIPDTAKATAPSESQLLHGFFPPQDNSQNYLSDFDAIWKDYVELGPNMDVPEWDNLFSDLDSRLPDTMRQAPDLSQDRSGRGL